MKDIQMVACFNTRYLFCMYFYQFTVKYITLFFLKPFKTPRCQFCTEMSNFCYLRKPRLFAKLCKFVTVPTIHTNPSQLPIY